ncbi:MAG: LysR family transcriptional regulator [Bdellovibrio sp.]
MAMSLSSIQLDAFIAAAKVQSFSGAAKILNITQSALSQRILNLESEIGSTLFIREPTGIRVTELGQRLLRYCQMKDSLEAEFMNDIGFSKGKELGGLIKIGGFSTVVRSVLIPSVQSILQESSEVQVEFHTKEVRELPGLLESGEADFILLNRPFEKQGVENIELGFEEYVLVEPKSGVYREQVFLDHDSADSTTAEFLKHQGKKLKSFKRSYFDEIYSIIDGVLLGAGRAVIPFHLAKQTKGLVVSKGFQSSKVPVFLCFYQQAFYTNLQKRVIQNIKSEAPKMLKSI